MPWMEFLVAFNQDLFGLKISDVLFIEGGIGKEMISFQAAQISPSSRISSEFPYGLFGSIPDSLVVKGLSKYLRQAKETACFLKTELEPGSVSLKKHDLGRYHHKIYPDVRERNLP